MKILVTGAAGFIGYHLCEYLLGEGHSVIGLDNINDYYDSDLKFGRLEQLGISRECAKIFTTKSKSTSYENLFCFIRLNLEDREELPKVFNNENFDLVVNLAAQAGVRHSIDHPQAYIDSNIIGFSNVLECCRHNNVKRLIYASSSSVYGNSSAIPFSESHCIDAPVSLYAATKASNELMAHTYSHLFDIETIGFRFFTVYGPWGRPDMAMFLFTKAILNGEPIKVFNHGNLSRDFTFIDDIIRGMSNVVQDTYKKRSMVYNIGNSKPVPLLHFIEALESELGKSSKKEMLPMQDGDVEKTWADTELLQKEYSYKPKTTIKEGIQKFVNWYNHYYRQ